MEGRRRGTMATANCEKSTRPHDTSPDHSTSQGDLRSRWSSDASLLIAENSSASPSGSQEPSITLKPGDPAGGRDGERGGSGENLRSWRISKRNLRRESREMRANLSGGLAGEFRRTCVVLAVWCGNSSKASQAVPAAKRIF